MFESDTKKQRTQNTANVLSTTESPIKCSNELKTEWLDELYNGEFFFSSS